MKIKILFAVILSAVILQGCSFTDRGNTYNSSPTVGQELIDLHAAHDTGVINTDEFEILKAKIIRR